MSLTRKASSAARKPTKRPPQDPAAALAEREAELAEARRQQTATSDILKVIASSPGELQPVLDKIVEAACRLCNAYDAVVLLREGDQLRVAAHYGPIPITFASQAISRGLLAGRAVIERRAIHIDDIAKHADEYPVAAALASQRTAAGSGEMLWRANLVMPLIREGEAVGVIGLRRAEPVPFSEGQIELLKTFSDQAVIAIENVRLFDEVQARTSDLTESLEQQTASADILRVISQSPTDARPVFERIVVTAARVLKCDLAAALLRDGDTFSPAATANAQGLLTDFVPALRVPIDPNANFPSRAILGKTTLHLPDWSLIDVPQHEREIQNLVGVNSALYLPLLREAECIGLLALLGTRPNSFGPKEIVQAESFRDQALIAIENARLFRETQEALEQQKASAEVLGAISKSVADTAPVFETILDACQRLFGSEELGIYTIGDDQMVRAAAWRGPRAEEARQDVTPLADSVTGRVIRERRPHHIPDLSAVPDLSPTLRDRVSRHGGASLLYAPMLQEDGGLGSIVVVRWPPRPFSDREQVLLQTFADQAAIAIENVRLFRGTQQALERQTATAEILKVIASSPSEVQPVFEAIATTANRLLGGISTTVWRFVDERMFLVAFTPTNPAADEALQASFPRPIADMPPFLPVLDGRTQQIVDIEAQSGVPALLRDLGRLRGFRSILFTPLMSNGAAIGMISVTRREAGAFVTADVQLLRTFADQAVIAIENVRLFDEVQARTKDLQEALQQQTATTNVLKVISRSAFDLDSVLKTLTDSARSLSGAATAAVFLRDGDLFPVRAKSGVAPEFLEYLNAHPARPGKATLIGRVAMTGEAVQIPDVREDPDYDYGVGPQIGDYRSLFGAPLIRDGKVEGVFGLMHPKPSAFMPSQMEMVRAFADQAVIAIENARLFDEVQARTRDLTDALQQQTATADVLKVISRSAFDLPTVLHTLVESAAKLCDAEKATITREIGGLYYRAEWYGFSDEFMREYRDIPVIAERGTISGRALLEGTAIHVDDVRADPEYTFKDTAEAGDFRTCLAIPMLRNGAPIGVLVMFRTEVRPFNQQADRPRADLRRPGGDRDRERTPVRRGAGAHPRPHGSAGAADGDKRGAVGDQPVADRSAAGVRRHRSQRNRIVRGDKRRRRPL